MKELFKSAVYMIITKNNKVLVQRRKGTKVWNNYYALPAGHIDVGENQYEALIREAKEELGIDIDIKNIVNSYTVLRRNYYEIDNKKSDNYIDFYFEINKYNGIPKIVEKDKCSELIWVDIHNLPEPFTDYEGDFLEDRTIKTCDYYEMGKYIKKNNSDILLNNIDKIHTTELGIKRIKKNININCDTIVSYIKEKIKDNNCNIYKNGKNWYCEIDNIRITINSYSYSIITVHKI